ncbi:hypothetical protein ACFRMN_08270 [Streptomyces sp. NPDC056835]|uniref:hypothetical protein n=1 Tax=Streptomyces sp. NPDC056835 TaxID=3345956 RepID=UPI0036CA0CFF
MEQLARALSVTARRRGLIYNPARDRIYKWEHRLATPSEDYQMLLADVLGIEQSRVVALG